MSEISLKFRKISKTKLVIIAALAMVLVTLPMFAFSSKAHKSFVDANTTGTQDGSSAHPFKTISEAIKKADGNTEIHVAKGTYKENLNVKNDVKIFGDSKDGVVIKAKDDGDAVVVLHDDTKINKVTIKEGKNGIWVEKNSKTSIIDCVIKDNDHDGIATASDGTKDSKMVSISDNEIKNNGWNGIFSRKRRLSITDNSIHGNDKDGVGIEKGSRVWMADNDIKDNTGSGLKLQIDGSDIWTKNNDIRGNKREGMEVLFAGQSGRINVSKSKFVVNGRYGIARVQTVWGSASLWAKYLTIENNNGIFGNVLGSISGIIHVN